MVKARIAKDHDGIIKEVKYFEFYDWGYMTLSADGKQIGAGIGISMEAFVSHHPKAVPLSSCEGCGTTIYAELVNPSAPPIRRYCSECKKDQDRIAELELDRIAKEKTKKK